MFRELATLLVVVFAVFLYFIIAGPMIEPVAEQAKKGEIDHGGIDGSTSIDRVIDMVYLYVPLFAVGGTLVWVLVSTFRKERRVGGGPP